jgi:heme/copper-type cytochrome/quinol oxidase subunit 2
VGARRWFRGALAVALATVALALPGLAAAGSTDAQQTAPLIWVMLALSIAGAVIVFAVLVWALVRFRDPRTKGRRYG